MNNEILVSVILATRDPRPHALERTLAALAAQDLEKDRWELILVDNGSALPVAQTVNVDWHGRARIVTEPKAGRSHAIARGISLSVGKLVLFCDDDNVLKPNYLTIGRQIFDTHPQLGCCGGNITPEFEQEAPINLASQLHMLAIVHLSQSRVAGDGSVMPPGAGSIYRSEVARKWEMLFSNDPIRQKLGSRFDPPCVLQEDIDMCIVAQTSGFMLGQFHELCITHLISSDRVQLPYLLKLSRANGAGTQVTRWIWDGKKPDKPWWKQFWQYCRIQRLPAIQRQFALEYWRGERAAIHFIKQNQRYRKL